MLPVKNKEFMDWERNMAALFENSDEVENYRSNPDDLLVCFDKHWSCSPKDQGCLRNSEKKGYKKLSKMEKIYKQNSVDILTEVDIDDKRGRVYLNICVDGMQTPLPDPKRVENVTRHYFLPLF